MTAEELASAFHEAYERLAPQYGYKTRTEYAKPWAEVPESNRRLMTAVAREILDRLYTLDPIGDGGFHVGTAVQRLRLTEPPETHPFRK